MMIIFYKLQGKMVVSCESAQEWAVWMESNSKHVADETIGGIRISTVFLGLDHNFCSSGDPLLFETAIFSLDDDIKQIWRYFTYAEAEQGHKEIVETIKQQVAEADFSAMDVIRKLSSRKAKEN